MKPDDASDKPTLGSKADIKQVGTSGVGMSNYNYLPGVCKGDSHAYPTIYSGDPQYAAEYFSHCLCGKKKKVTTITEVDR